MKRKALCMTLILLIIVASSIIIISIADDIPIIKVVSKLIIFLAKGFDRVFFTPYLLIAVIVIWLVINPENLIKLSKKLSEIFDELWGIKFKKQSQEEIPLSVEKASNEINNSLISQTINKNDIHFYKELLTKNMTTLIARYFLYAVDQPNRPTVFSLEQLVEWTFGTQAMQIAKSQDYINSFSYTASLLIQTGALLGSLSITDNSKVVFESVTVNPNAHIALEELTKEGYKMIPEVIIDNSKQNVRK